MVTLLETDNDGRQWYVLDGVDYGTDYAFCDDVYGVTTDGRILDADGYPLIVGDIPYIAVCNALRGMLDE